MRMMGPGGIREGSAGEGETGRVCPRHGAGQPNPLDRGADRQYDARAALGALAPMRQYLHELDDEVEIADEAQVTTIEDGAGLGPPPE
jgi:hypothetical protein